MFRFILVSALLCGPGALLAGEYTPVMFTQQLAEVDLALAKPWQKPNYTGQDEALGYEPGAFGIPAGMESRVSFWIDIYTKYSTDQGLLHDSQYVHLVYEEVDFRDIMKREDLSLSQKRRARSKLVTKMKEEIQDRLKRLSKLSSPAGLEGEDLRYWYMFARVDEPNKFKHAMRKGRLRFQLGQNDRFVKGIYQSGRYIKKMEEIFASEGLPKELTRLPFVESSFNLKARSRVGASGIWQFILSTGRRYMKINYSVDERNDPLTATRSAARYLRAAYNQLGNWPLAVTAYNRGTAGVRRLTRRYKTSDLAQLVDERHGRFGFASANFYASFLAAVEVDKNADKYFGKVFHAPEIEAQEITLAKSINSQTLLKWFGGDKDKARLFNPHVKDNVWKGWTLLDRRNFIRVPQDRYETAVADLKALKDQVPHNLKGRSYKISRGDTLSDIAQQFGVSVRSLRSVNGISNPRRIRAGQKLIIPMQ